MKRKIRIALIGCGNMGRGHMSAFRKHLPDDYEVVAVCDRVEDKAVKLANDYNAPAKFYADYNDVLNIEGLDAVDICTPNYLHSTIAVAALNKGLHVLCEKPDAVSVEEAVKMKKAADESGKLLMVIRNNRFIPHMQYIKNYIDEGNVGEIYAARCGWQRRRGIPGKGGWFTTKAQSGGGPLIDLGVHMIDVTMWMMGNPKPVTVSGCTYCKFSDNDVSESVDSSFGEKKADGIFDVEDLAMGYIRFDNGACMQIEFSWASNVQGDDKFFEIRGTKAGASYHSTDDKLKIFTEQDGKTVDIVPEISSNGSGHVGNIKNFAEAVRGDAEPIFKPEQGLNMIKILAAIYESAKTGREVVID